MIHGEGLAGKPFDWVAANRAANDVVMEDGQINHWAAAAADPGLVKCRKCDRFLWHEFAIIRCPCGGATGWGLRKAVMTLVGWGYEWPPMRNL